MYINKLNDDEFSKYKKYYREKKEELEVVENKESLSEVLWEIK